MNSKDLKKIDMADFYTAANQYNVMVEDLKKRMKRQGAGLYMVMTKKVYRRYKWWIRKQKIKNFFKRLFRIK